MSVRTQPGGSDLIALVPASFMAAQPDTLREPAHTFALPVATEPITVSMLWHPRLEHDAAHRWLRGLFLSEFRLRVPLRRVAQAVAVGMRHRYWSAAAAMPHTCRL
ncbi:hypothetical protein NG831_02755 [Xanthomonas sacchari]|uniref:hypothetical protein n=1 Tax=Xanthomonas sacchari TaxID=56458 RepID=UPI00225B7EB4|nr:hypothetical protein [Xanthomonas sacchari]UYK67144.1 hypothetical protein NG831_02755 [Xanthomonas sacchari]UYK77323.1 hypothetical protein NG825_02870 [Xanthomonas sacchari]